MTSSQEIGASPRSLRDVRGHRTNRFFEVGLFDGGEQVATVGHFGETWWASTNYLETKTSGVVFCANAAAAFALARLAPRIAPRAMFATRKDTEEAEQDYWTDRHYGGVYP